ncbi:hypothetical protein AB0H51_28045 [Streptomyces griseoluteus]|uniref:hypothetical protein n=1 Tax=Streptomyces griseoluteus TaxID=29306 RepID=UPI0033CA39F0
MPQSLQRAAIAMHPAALLTVISFLLNACISRVVTGQVPVGFLALLALVSGGTAALTGNGLRASLAFLVAGGLAPLSMWAALIPAAVVITWRIRRRLDMLSQVDKTAPRGERMGFWGTLQAWAGWSTA